MLVKLTVGQNFKPISAFRKLYYNNHSAPPLTVITSGPYLFYHAQNKKKRTIVFYTRYSKGSFKPQRNCIFATSVDYISISISTALVDFPLISSPLFLYTQLHHMIYCIAQAFCNDISILSQGLVPKIKKKVSIIIWFS